MSNELQKAAENASFQMWQAYCDKKMECEDLQEQVETQAARIAELERENRYLQDVCAELEAQVQQLQRALTELEAACDKRAALTSSDVYNALADLPGMSVALLELDVARAQARKTTEGAHNITPTP